MAEDVLLEVKRLRVAYKGRTGPVPALHGVSFDLMARERLGIVGESGSGKSTVGRAILGLLPASAIVEADRLALRGTDLLSLDEAGLRAIRGRRVSMVLQDPKYSLNPVMTVGEQIAESYRLHTKSAAREARRR